MEEKVEMTETSEATGSVEGEEKKNTVNSVKKVFGIIKTVLVWMIVALAVFMMIFTLVSVNTFDQNERNIFGYKFFIVKTDSMSATDFDAGDVAISKTVDPSTLKEGDIITFISQNSESFGETITHKIRKLTTDAAGDPGFVTYGTTTDTDDATVVTYPFVVGKYQGRVPKLGNFFMFLKTTPGYIVCILIPFLLLILSQGINFVRIFRRYRAEQMQEMQSEREKLEQERAESQRMMAELLALKAQLEQKDREASEPSVAPSEAPASTEASESVAAPDTVVETSASEEVTVQEPTDVSESADESTAEAPSGDSKE